MPSEADMGRLADRYKAELAFASGCKDAGVKPEHQAKRRFVKAARARGGWFNWYVNRGRLPLSPTRKELRALSNRRVF